MKRILDDNPKMDNYSTQIDTLQCKYMKLPHFFLYIENLVHMEKDYRVGYFQQVVLVLFLTYGIRKYRVKNITRKVQGLVKKVYLNSMLE